jgi:acylphosphatase
MIARRVRITGRVQGVFFRAWTRDEARSIGVHGWVRNCPDGTVEAHIEGDETPVGELIRRMRHGPPHAKVMDLEISDAAVEDIGRFEVRH